VLNFEKKSKIAKLAKFREPYLDLVKEIAKSFKDVHRPDASTSLLWRWSDDRCERPALVPPAGSELVRLAGQTFSGRWGGPNSAAYVRTQQKSAIFF